MNRKLTISSVMLTALLASTAGAFAQAAANDAATIPGSEMRANEMRRPNTAPGTTTGSAMSERPRDQTTRAIQSDRRLPENVPGDATEGAPAGR